MVASQDKRVGSVKAHIGTMGWSYSFWTGNFYPEDTKSPAFLSEYAKHFDTVELDNTFYRMPSEKIIRTWREQTPEDFVFSAKFPRIITHIKMLRSCESETHTFISRMAGLRNKLGPLLLQFPKSFGTKQLPLLRDFLQTLPKKSKYAVEVRNKTLNSQQLQLLLKSNGVAQVLVCEPLLQHELTADFVYVRFEGDRDKVNGTLGKIEIDRTRDILKIAVQVRELLKHKTEVFVYFSKYYSGFPPKDAAQLINSLEN